MYINRKLLKITITILTIFVCLISFFNLKVLAAEKRIEVNLSNQTLQAFEGNTLVYSFVVSTGNPWTPTPTGTYWPAVKLRYTDMEGGNKKKETYYNLPNVPYVIYFENNNIPWWQGYALHGTYWHNNFGVPMSHGCINMKTEDAEKIYNWIGMSPSTGNGTNINIYGTTPTK